MADTPTFHVPDFTSHNPLGSNIDLAASKGRSWLNDTLKSMGIDATIAPSDYSNNNTAPSSAQANVNNNPSVTPQAAPIGKQNDMVFEIKQGFQNLNDTMMKIRNDTDLVNQNFTSSLSIQNKMALALDKMTTKLDRMSKAIENMPTGGNGPGINPSDLLGNGGPNEKTNRAKNQPRDAKGRFVKRGTNFNAKPTASSIGGSLLGAVKSAKLAGIMSLLGAGATAYDEYEQSGNIGRTAAVGGGSLFGGLGGGLGGGAIGTALGGAIGGLFGGVGAVPGAAIGGYLGTAVGGYFGSSAGEAVGRFGYDATLGKQAVPTPKITNDVAALTQAKAQDSSKQLDLNLDKLNITVKEFNLNGVPLEKILSGQGGLNGLGTTPMAQGGSVGPNGSSVQNGQYQSSRDPNASSQSTPFRQNNNYPVAPGAGRGGADSGPSAPIKEGKEGQYRPVYDVGDKDLTDRVINTIAGEARMKDPRSVDAVINNMYNRLGTHAYGRSNNLNDVASAPGQYAGYRRASPAERQMIEERIRAIGSGKVEDITGGANEYRAAWYAGPWARKHAGDSTVVGGNRFARNRAVSDGLYAPYEQPHEVKEGAQKSDGAKYPEWMDQRSRREISGVNADLARDLMAAAEKTGMHFSVTQGMRTPEEAAGNARSGRGVRDSQHLYGAAADIKLLDANGNPITDRQRWKQFGDTYQGVSKEHGGQGRWLGNLQGRWGSDIWHFDQGLGYGQNHARQAYGDLKVTKEDLKDSAAEAYATNAFARNVLRKPDAKLNDTSPVSLAFTPSSSGVTMPAALNKMDTSHALEFTKSSEKRSLANDSHKNTSVHDIRHETKETKKKDPTGVHDKRPTPASPALDDLKRYFHDYA